MCYVYWCVFVCCVFVCVRGSRHAQTAQFSKLTSDIAASPATPLASQLRMCVAQSAIAIERDLKQTAPLRILREDLLECMNGHRAKFPAATERAFWMLCVRVLCVCGDGSECVRYLIPPPLTECSHRVVK